MNTLNTTGFTLVEALLAIIAIALVGGVGFYVYDSNKEEPSTKTSIVQQEDKKADEQKSAIPAGWTEYVDKEKGFSFSYPDDWGTASVKSVESPHNGEGYHVTFSKSDIQGMITNQSYQYTGPGRGGAYWELSGASYSEISQAFISDAEKAKTGDEYSTVIVARPNNAIVSAYNNCVDGGLVTGLLAQIKAKQEYVFSLSKLQSNELCQQKVDQSSIDQTLVDIFKQIPDTIQSL